MKTLSKVLLFFGLIYSCALHANAAAGAVGILIWVFFPEIFYKFSWWLITIIIIFFFGIILDNEIIPANIHTKKVIITTFFSNILTAILSVMIILFIGSIVGKNDIATGIFLVFGLPLSWILVDTGLQYVAYRLYFPTKVKNILHFIIVMNIGCALIAYIYVYFIFNLILSRLIGHG